MSKFNGIIGDVELDESYFGASCIKGNKVKLKRGRGTANSGLWRVYQDIYRDFARYEKPTLQAIWSFTKRRLAKFNGVKANFKFYLNSASLGGEEMKEFYNILSNLLKKKGLLG